MSKNISSPAEDDPDDEDGSVSRIIRRMKSGDPEGADFLWQRFFARLTYLVRERMGSQLRVMSDEEDVALQSLSEMFRGLMNGQYPSLDNREAFWRLLVTVASRNVMDEISQERRMKRGAGRVVNESSFTSSTDGSNTLFEQIASSEQAPDVQLMITERCTELLESLGDKQLQAIAVMKTAGSSNSEVAKNLGLSLRSVERRLSDIRARWAGTV
ncbi:MAG: ECF-type sigma factor [Fuerstiella sp.]